MKQYIGHESQLYGIEEHRLVGGKGDGMRLLEVRNGKGIDLTISLDRCADISRLRYRGMNVSYFSPCGYVAPAYYDKSDSNWLKSFTAGFLTTCGLENTGVACVDEGEALAMHGSIANIPASQSYWLDENGELIVRATMCDEVIFGRKLRLHREYRISTNDNVFTITDTVENTGDRTEPFEILYHNNIGYPLLDEDSVVEIPSAEVTPRDQHAAENIDTWNQMQKPEAGYQECCYYHKFADEVGRASIYQPKLNMGLEISFNAKELDGFVEWKMMGVRDYVLGLECANCYVDGRDVMHKNGMLKFLKPGEKKTYQVNVRFFEK